jgi:hypothetical protein
MTIASIFESLSSSPQVTSVELADPGVIFRFENGCRLEIHECYWSLRSYTRMNKKGEFETFHKLLATSHDQEGVKEYALKFILGRTIYTFIHCSFVPPILASKDQLKANTWDSRIGFAPPQGMEMTLEPGDIPFLDIDFHPLKSHESVNWVFVDAADHKTTSTQFHGLQRIV